MYTFLINENNTLTCSVQDAIMERSKMVDKLHFLADPTYKGVDMTDYTVNLEYVLPISKRYKTEILTKSDELYIWPPCLISRSGAASAITVEYS